MATVKELYDYIKLQQKEGKPITPLHESIIEAYEADETKTTKKVEVTFQKNENQDTYQSTQDQVEQKKQSE
tara:strand:+ start:1125 stop:1337 length:213 start_codon:yes stop_codon:yes gene_type:complete